MSHEGFRMGPDDYKPFGCEPFKELVVSDIPADIMETVIELVQRRELKTNNGDEIAIAIAILSERERCAKIADEQDGGMPSFGWNQCALKIATAIRNPKS